MGYDGRGLDGMELGWDGMGGGGMDGIGMGWDGIGIGIGISPDRSISRSPSGDKNRLLKYCCGIKMRFSSSSPLPLFVSPSSALLLAWAKTAVEESDIVKNSPCYSCRVTGDQQSYNGKHVFHQLEQNAHCHKMPLKIFS